ncbi:MAG: anti sigma factor C-terminal domain-containing protein [Velocimicrobium sp.]
MTYRELLEQYKKGKLDEDQRIKVEGDIERQDAISDYLYEEEMIPGIDASFEKITENGNSSMEVVRQSENDFVRLINKSIHQSFMKLGISVFVITMAVVLFIQFALPHMVSLFYYNPGKVIGENGNQMSLDLAVYTDLVIPGYARNNVSVDGNGYGDYDICINQNVSYNNYFTNLTGKVKKGKMILYDANVLKRPTGNAFAWFQMFGDQSKSLTELVSDGNQVFSSVGGQKQATEILQNLNENDKYIAFVTLNRMMKYEDFMAFLEKKGEFSAVWCAVSTNSSATGDSMFQADNIGFLCDLTSSTSLSWDEKTYPNLLLWSQENNNGVSTEDLERQIKTEKFMKTHFVSMLRYMSDQKKFLDMMNEDTKVFKGAADYIENNGITVYGFVAVMDKETLLSVNKMEEVYEICTQPLR